MGHAARVVVVRIGGDAAGGRVQPHHRLGHQQSGLDADLHRPDDAVAAHGAPALIVEKEDAERPVGCHRLGGDAAVHVGVAARLPHQCRAKAVEVLAGVAPLGQDGVAGDGRQPAGDDAQWFAGGMGVDSSDQWPVASDQSPPSTVY